MYNALQQSFCNVNCCFILSFYPELIWIFNQLSAHDELFDPVLKFAELHMTTITVIDLSSYIT